MQLPAVSALVAVACCAGGALATGDVHVLTLEKNGTGTDGSAAVAARGSLAPFGDIGVGCGINWNDDTGFGGGLQAGSPTLGLGGGWAVGPHNMTAGIGIGLPEHAKANVSIALDYKGVVEFQLTSSGPLECFPSKDRNDNDYHMVCRTASQ